MQRQGGGGLTFRACSQWLKQCVMWMGDETLANLERVAVEDTRMMSGFTNEMHCGNMASTFSSHVFFPLFFLLLQEKEENSSLSAFWMDSLDN